MILRIFLLFMCVVGLQAAPDKYTDIKATGIINIGVKYDFKPFGFIDNRGRLVGFDIELARFIADKLKVTPKFHQVTSENRIPTLLKDDIDIIVASMTHKISRDKEIDFSISYYFDGQSILVREDEISTKVKEFANRKVGAIKGATSGPNFKKLVPKARVVYFSEYPQALRALKRGNIDAITTDYTWCVQQAKDSNETLKVVGGLLSFEPYGIGMQENQSKLRDAINFVIIELVKEGVYAELYEKWFGEKPERYPSLWPK